MADDDARFWGNVDVRGVCPASLRALTQYLACQESPVELFYTVIPTGEGFDLTARSGNRSHFVVC
jgi:hypothetical protein